MRRNNFFLPELLVEQSVYSSLSAKEIVRRGCEQIVHYKHPAARFEIEWSSRGGQDGLNPDDYMPIFEMLVEPHPLKSLTFTCSAEAQRSTVAYVQENIVPVIEAEPHGLQTIRVNGQVAWQNSNTPAAAVSAESMRPLNMTAGH